MPARNPVLELEGDRSEDPPIIDGCQNHGPIGSRGDVGDPPSVVIPARFAGRAELLVGKGCHVSRLLVLVGKWFSHLDTHPSQGTALPCDAMRRELRIVEDLAAAFADVFLEVAPRAVSLAGGNTPRPCYEHLASLEYRWNEVDVFFGDERCVPPEHPDSNFRMASDALLSRIPARGHRMPGESCDAAAYERQLREVLGPHPAMDLAVLGLGEDGHTASLFPGDPALEETKRLVVRVERPDHPRLTLTLPVLSASPVAVFLVEGERKREALRLLLIGADIPAARVTAERVVILADPTAAP
jgi:6-phosphogluconolactonase